MSFARSRILGAALLLAASSFVLGADTTLGAVVQSGGNIVRQNPSLPKLNLSAAQRERIRQMLLTKHTEI
jgi:hypothetical protein